MSTPEGRLLETVADIAFIAGTLRFDRENSREDVQSFITWAKEFETFRSEKENGEEVYSPPGCMPGNYLDTIECFAGLKIMEALNG